MNRPHQGIKGLKKKGRAKEGCTKGKSQINGPFWGKRDLSQGPFGLRAFHFNTLY